GKVQSSGCLSFLPFHFVSFSFALFPLRLPLALPPPPPLPFWLLDSSWFDLGPIAGRQFFSSPATASFGTLGSGTLQQGEDHSADSFKHDSVSNGTVMTAGSEDCIKHLCMTDGRANDKGDPVVPNTPNPLPEYASPLSDSMTPPFVVSAHLPNSACIEERSNMDDASSDETPRTAQGSMFNPFAPGPDGMLLGPLRKNFHKELRNVVARRLLFYDSSDAVTVAMDSYDEDYVEDMLQELVRGTFLEAILLYQTELFLAEHNQSHNQTHQTPLLHPPAIGTGHTCPGAPMRSKPDRRISVTVINGLCRKLEF
ncbi:hypothetical protein AKJ16_DCAP05353, partial [Drosera capensis]